MPRGVYNWTYDDVVTFLKDNNFRLNYTEGSHHFYIGTKGGQIRQVCVAFHGKRAFKPRTLKSMIAQSGMDKSEWFNY